MLPEIRPPQLDDLPALSRFLTDGFGAPADADFAAVDVLAWKYLEPIGTNATPRSFIACDEGRIVGHIGVSPTTFWGPGLPAQGVSALHIIDWLGTREQRAVGSSLMRRVHQMSDTQYVLVANDRARRVTRGAGYEPRVEVPVYQRILRAGYRWKLASHGTAGRLLRVVKDTGRKALNRSSRPTVDITVRQVREFGAEVEPILAASHARWIMTDRCPARLNHALRYPRPAGREIDPNGTSPSGPGMTGWLIESHGQSCGFALLNVVCQGAVRTGKLVEYLLGRDDIAWEHAACTALTAILAEQGADLAIAFASTPTTAEALRCSGFALAHRLEFTLRDREQRIPQGAVFHLSPFEADYAYQ